MPSYFVWLSVWSSVWFCVTLSEWVCDCPSDCLSDSCWFHMVVCLILFLIQSDHVPFSLIPIDVVWFRLIMLALVPAWLSDSLYDCMFDSVNLVSIVFGHAFLLVFGDSILCDLVLSVSVYSINIGFTVWLIVQVCPVRCNTDWACLILSSAVELLVRLFF